MVPPGGQGAPILVVDDDADSRQLVATCLRREGFGVREAASGEAALELIEGEAIGLVILDMSMPGMSGTDVVRALRERPGTATLPIMVLTGKGGQYPLAASLGVGADDYLTKPIRLEDLVARVRSHLRTVRVTAERATRETEELYRTLVEHSADGILVSDRSGRYVEANQAISRMLGYSRDELLAMTSPGLSAIDDPLTPEDMDVRLAETAAGTGLLVQRRYRRKDGTSLPAEVGFSQLPDGRLQRNIRDVSVRLAAEAALRESERNLAAAQRIAHIGSWEWDLLTDTAQRSAELHRIYGVEPGAIPATTEAFLAFVHPDDRARVQAAERAAVTSDAPYEMEYRAVRPDGSVRIIHDEAEVVRDPSGRAVRMVGIVRDVTDLRAAEAERSRLVSAVDQAADSLWVTDVDGVVTYVNPSFTRVYGYEPGEVIGRTAQILDSDRHTETFFADIRTAVKTGLTWSGTIVNRRKDGALVEVERVISAIRDAEGGLTGYIRADRDVTRERELERAHERRVRDREAIGSALARIDPAGSAEEIAAAACAVINELPEVDSTVAVALEGVEGTVVASVGRLAPTFTPGTRLSEGRTTYLRERGLGGPWFEESRPAVDHGVNADSIASSGLGAIAFAPMRGPQGVVGVVAITNHDPANAASLIERMPTLAAFASILGALLVPKLEARRRETGGRSTIQAILDASAFMPYFQPIVDLNNNSVVGYEALTRFVDGVPPDARFAAAAGAGLGIELEIATMRAALSAAGAVLPSPAYLSLNASPGLISSGALRAMFADVDRGLVLEITEHTAIDDYVALRADLAALGPTVRLAVDDAGAGYASFRHILELAPDLVKLDIGLVRGIDADPARQALLAGMTYFAAKRRIRLVAEGIETLGELKVLRSLAIAYGQGYLFGRPQDGRGPGPWPTVIAVKGGGRAAGRA